MLVDWVGVFNVFSEIIRTAKSFETSLQISVNRAHDWEKLDSWLSWPSGFAQLLKAGEGRRWGGGLRMRLKTSVESRLSSNFTRGRWRKGEKDFLKSRTTLIESQTQRDGDFNLLIWRQSMSGANYLISSDYREGCIRDSALSHLTITQELGELFSSYFPENSIEPDPISFWLGLCQTRT